VSGFLKELVREGPEAGGNPTYPVYIDGVEVGEFVPPPMPWWVAAAVIVGVIGGVETIVRVLRRRS